MNLTYVFLSPTFGLHQYTADLANRMAAAGNRVHLITTRSYPADRYAPEVNAHTPVMTHNSGLDFRSGRPGIALQLAQTIASSSPEVVHFTGPHVWNTAIMSHLRRFGIPSVHTLHDLDPHAGALYGSLLNTWNREVIKRASQIMVHAKAYREHLLHSGLTDSEVTYVPLLHLFVGHRWRDALPSLSDTVSYDHFVLFFGRVERYKGVRDLLAAWALMDKQKRLEWRLVIAGLGDIHRFWTGSLPAGVEVRFRLIGDEEAIDLFRRCSLLVLPYTAATQSALIPAAYYFHKPVISTPSGALPEYVQEGETGWVVTGQHPPSFSRCLSAALSDHARLASMGEKGRKWYDEQRSVEEHTLRVTYERVADRGCA